MVPNRATYHILLVALAGKKSIDETSVETMWLEYLYLLVQNQQWKSTMEQCLKSVQS